MYASFFGFKHEPFSIAPDPRYLYMSGRHREALAHLLYGVKGAGGGFVLLTGEIGAGKTTVCRCLLEQIPKHCDVAYIFNPKLTALELLKTVCDEFHVPYTHDGPGQATVKDYLDPLNTFLLKTHAVGLNNVLIIDEAQNLSSDVLEQLRLLTNLETNQRKLLQIVLIGQPELRTMLARPELEQLAQRVIARYHLDALSEGETVKYLQHRLGVAGLVSANPFTRRAMLRIHRRSRGVPRRINLLADRALLGAYADGVARVDHRIVERAAAEVFGPDERLQRLGRVGRLAPWSLGLALGAALASTAALWLQRDPPAAPSSAALKAAALRPAASAASPAASAATAPASGAIAAAKPIFITAADLTTRFSTPLRREADAWRELAPLWPEGGPDASAADPCASSTALPWQCFKSSNGGLALIRQLDRPGLLTLHDDSGRPLYVVLVGLDERSATLRLGGQNVTVSLVSLASLWQGDFATYWRAPAGYRRTVGDGDDGALVDQLAAQLAALRGEAVPAGAQRYDAAMKSRVQAFQLAHGIQADGLAGPATFMQLARAFDPVGARSEPRLTGNH
jgi:general secretion pathway protein A